MIKVTINKFSKSAITGGKDKWDFRSNKVKK